MWDFDNYLKWMHQLVKEHSALILINIYFWLPLEKKILIYVYNNYSEDDL